MLLSGSSNEVIEYYEVIFDICKMKFKISLKNFFS